jgi:hypothetical protein
MQPEGGEITHPGKRVAAVVFAAKLGVKKLRSAIASIAANRAPGVDSL